MAYLPDLALGSTAIQLHWPHGIPGTIPSDTTHIYARHLAGESLHTTIDTLLEELALSPCGSPVITEITVTHATTTGWLTHTLHSRLEPKPSKPS